MWHETVRYLVGLTTLLRLTVANIKQVQHGHCGDFAQDR